MVVGPMIATGLPPIPPLPPELMQLGADANLLADELRYLIMLHGTQAPRSQQREIGPSQVGTPCLRKLGFLIADSDPRYGVAHGTSGNWRTAVGTAVHAYLAEVFAGINADLHDREGVSRFLIETTVDVGEINRIPVLGHADLYDRVTGSVIDWKIVGPTTIKGAKANGPRATYRVQAHLYGRGFIRRGAPVERVAIMYLPSAGDMRDSFCWSEPYDEEVALSALRRAEAVAQSLIVAGVEKLIPALTTADDYCTGCPWFRPGIRTPGADGCPGHMRAAGPLPDAATVIGA